MGLFGSKINEVTGDMMAAKIIWCARRTSESRQEACAGSQSGARHRASWHIMSWEAAGGICDRGPKPELAL